MPDLEKGLLEEIEKEKLKEDKNEELEVAEKAVAEAQTEAKKPNSSKRLKDMVDEYMEGLQKMNNSKTPNHTMFYQNVNGSLFIFLFFR